MKRLESKSTELGKTKGQYEEMESVEELGNAKDYLTGVGIGVGIVVSIVTIT